MGEQGGHPRFWDNREINLNFESTRRSTRFLGHNKGSLNFGQVVRLSQILDQQGSHLKFWINMEANPDLEVTWRPHKATAITRCPYKKFQFF